MPLSAPATTPAVLPVPAWPERRAVVLLLVMLAWSGLLVLRLGRLMLFPGPELKAAVTQDAWFRGEIPAPRGCLFDRDGRMLAWSTHHFALRWRVPADPRRRAEDWRRIRRYLPVPEPATAWPAGSEATVIADLNPNELAAASLLCEGVPRLRLHGWSARHRQPGDRALAAYLGETRLVDGRECGVSGTELAHDAVLRGVSGRFRVMLDRHGRWLPDSWQKESDMVPGYDVYLPVHFPSGPPAAKPRRPSSRP